MVFYIRGIQKAAVVDQFGDLRRDILCFGECFPRVQSGTKNRRVFNRLSVLSRIAARHAYRHTRRVDRVRQPFRQIAGSDAVVQRYARDAGRLIDLCAVARVDILLYRPVFDRIRTGTADLAVDRNTARREGADIVPLFSAVNIPVAVIADIRGGRARVTHCLRHALLKLRAAEDIVFLAVVTALRNVTDHKVIPAVMGHAAFTVRIFDLSHYNTRFEQILRSDIPRQYRVAVNDTDAQGSRSHPVVIIPQIKREHRVDIGDPRPRQDELPCTDAIVACESDETLFFRDDHFSRLDSNHNNTSNHAEKNKKVA